MKNFIDSVKALGEKMTGKEIEGTELVDVVDEVTDKYEGSGGGTTVIANPELSGNEAELTGLQVGETKYKVPQGGGTTPHLYQYFATINFGETSPRARITIMFLSSVQLINPEEQHCIDDFSVDDLIPLMYVGASVKCGDIDEFDEITETPGFVIMASSDVFRCYIYDSNEGNIIWNIDHYEDIDSIRLELSKQFF